MKTSKEHQLLKDMVDLLEDLKTTTEATEDRAKRDKKLSSVELKRFREGSIEIGKLIEKRLEKIISKYNEPKIKKLKRKKETNFFADLLAGLYKSEPKFI